ncbi:MAG: hypothetical protein K0Q92_2495 [Steroidobacteraceae bacterium]|jgi:hypothetical protein|nr:hypothetical protein [Steroidobacteraceae bacterium]
MVSIGLLLFTALRAADAGRTHENGTGAMWIAPGLVEDALPALPCSHSVTPVHRELVFETLAAEDIDEDVSRLAASAAREVVTFEWHAATGELTFSTDASTAVFSDLAPSFQVSSASTRSCGSR